MYLKRYAHGIIGYYSIGAVTLVFNNQYDSAYLSISSRKNFSNDVVLLKALYWGTYEGINAEKIFAHFFYDLLKFRDLDLPRHP